ncbi:unnamed protein product [Staurois parvus]|uniref:Uncharacterized protein n=1 Tax=Staurois parvus TaxID=386267 RepID=A0ABN9EIT2_9NEOB|nr:unnamed protein product [Staurois parvus]
MLKSPPSSSVGRRLSRVQWQSGGAEAASLKAIHRPRLKSGSRQQREQTTETHGAGCKQKFL